MSCIAWMWLIAGGCREQKSSGSETGTSETETAPPETGDTGTPAVAACFPDDLGGAVVSSPDAGWTLKEGCDQGEYLMLSEGSGALDIDSLVAIKDRHATELQSLYGGMGHGVGTCCSGRDELCISVMVSTFTSPIEDLSAQLAGIFGEEQGCLGIKVYYVGETGPRCEQSDPDCVPFPFCGVDSLCCSDGPTYLPEASRIPVAEQHPELAYLQTGSCDHDGDCFRDTDRWCDAYDAPADINTMALYCPEELEEALCGCVEGMCQWFYQQ